MTTLNALISKYNELALAAGKPTRKGFDSKAKAEAAIKSLSKGAKVKIAKVKREVKAHEAGPRGFKFGPVWTESVKAGKGVALMAVNLPKLIAHATSLNIKITPDLNQAEIAGTVAKAI